MDLTHLIETSRARLHDLAARANLAQDHPGWAAVVLGGVLVSVLSYLGVFWIAIGFQLAAVVIVAFFVDEPRRRARQPATRER